MERSKKEEDDEGWGRISRFNTDVADVYSDTYWSEDDEDEAEPIGNIPVDVFIRNRMKHGA